MEATKEPPGAAGTARGGRDDQLGSLDRPEPIGKDYNPKMLVVRLPPYEVPTTFRGREAQTMALLVDRGKRGFTSEEASRLGWARRTSHYIYRLRRMGVEVTTLRERVGDAWIGRYVLQSPVVVIPKGEDVPCE